MVHFHIISIFPDLIDSYVNESIIGRAQKNKKIKITVYNPRDFAKNKWGKVDDRPFGGGPGMVLEALPIVRAVLKARGKKKDAKVIILSPGGKQFTNTKATEYAKKYKHIILIAGHYEGVDERVKKILKAEEISVGPYVLTGGEIPALIIVDSVTRQIEGALGNKDSIEEKRFGSTPSYTRPESFVHKGKTHRVPKVLLSGNHKEIESWRLQQAQGKRKKNAKGKQQ